MIDAMSMTLTCEKLDEFDRNRREVKVSRDHDHRSQRTW